MYIIKAIIYNTILQPRTPQQKFRSPAHLLVTTSHTQQIYKHKKCQLNNQAYNYHARMKRRKKKQEKINVY